MSKHLLLRKRVSRLEDAMSPYVPVYVAKVEGWGFGIRFPGYSEDVECDWVWDPRCENPETRKDACMIGATYIISLEPFKGDPGRRFESREEAEAWIREDKKNYPKNTFEWKRKLEGEEPIE